MQWDMNSSCLPQLTSLSSCKRNFSPLTTHASMANNIWYSKWFPANPKHIYDMTSPDMCISWQETSKNPRTILAKGFYPIDYFRFTPIRRYVWEKRLNHQGTHTHTLKKNEGIEGAKSNITWSMYHISIAWHQQIPTSQTVTHLIYIV